MKKLNKKDYLYLTIIIISFLSLVLLLIKTNFYYGSTLDWYAEHVSIPEYFRTLFYKTKDFFPDFAANIGSGQNIYNLSYYGFLSPIILLSYCLPFVSMTNYIIVSTIILVICSIILIYIFLKKHNNNSEICFISSFLFALSSPLVFHSHRHIMFINYMPFLIMGLFGVDKKIKEHKSWLLILSVFLITMTSYYFSIGSILCLIIYAIYSYLKIYIKIDIKRSIRDLFKLLFSILIGVMSAAIVILPTFLTILNSRNSSNISLHLIDLISPLNTNSFIFYDYHGIGLTCLSIFALFNFIKKKKENIFLSSVLIVLTSIPVFSYFLNGTLYIDSKVLIPLLPLFIIIDAQFFNDIFNKKISKLPIIIGILITYIIKLLSNYQFILGLEIDIIACFIILIISQLIKHPKSILIPICLTIFLLEYNINNLDDLEIKEDINNSEKYTSYLINKTISNDSSFFRISNNIDINKTPNKIYNNLDYYNTTIYSSLSNQSYNNFYYEIENNNMPCRNDSLTVANYNIMNNLLLGNKYLISKHRAPIGYEEIYYINGYHLYQNNDVMSLGFATSNIMNYDDFNKLSIPEKQEALLKNIITNGKSNNNYISSVLETNINLDTILKDLEYEKNNNEYSLELTEDLNIVYNLPKKYKNKILFIHFDLLESQSCEEGDLEITINNVKNKLACSSWKYYNDNTNFDYTISYNQNEKLNLIFGNGKYKISNFKVYALDYANISNVKNATDSFNVDKKKTKGDKIIGDIQVTKNGYFLATVPYDEGFTIKVDNKKVPYEKVDNAFIGFKISEGYHTINIEYKAPLKTLSLIISLIGLISYSIVCLIESKRHI